MRSEDDHISFFLTNVPTNFYLNFESILSSDFNDKYTQKFNYITSIIESIVVCLGHVYILIFKCLPKSEYKLILIIFYEKMDRSYICEQTKHISSNRSQLSKSQLQKWIEEIIQHSFKRVNIV